MSALSDEILQTLGERHPTKLEMMEMIVRLLIEQIRLLEENAANREKALKQWHAKPTGS